MLLLLILAAASGAYYPPTSEDAGRAIAAHLVGGVEQASLDPHKPGFDISASIERCTFNESYDVRGPGGFTILVAGHECVITLSRRARPDYRVKGFFHHDGVDWRHYGPTDEALVAETATYAIGGGYSEITPKPGSILYRGDGVGPDLADPYQRILSGYSGLFEPASEPRQDGLYTEE